MPPEAGRRAKLNPKDQAPVPTQEPIPNELQGEPPPPVKWLIWIWANVRRHPGWALVAIAVLTTPAALTLYKGQAKRCTWNASDDFPIQQVDNVGSKSIINLHLSQNGKVLTGDANSVAGTAGSDEGKVQGAIDDTHFKVEIAWSKGPVGVYEGEFDSNGSLRGIAYDKRTTSNTASWSAVHSFACR
jgi:hypothetical protein